MLRGISTSITVLVFIFATRLCNSDAINVTASVGLGHRNRTFYLIKDMASWYSASNLCDSAVSGSAFRICGYTCFQYLANTLYSEHFSVPGNLLWVSQIKEQDDNIYTFPECAEDSEFTAQLKPEQRNGQISCVAANISAPDSLMTTDDCNKTYYYVCEKRNYINTEYDNRMFYRNVSILYNISMVSESTEYNVTLDVCDSRCNGWFKCLGYIFVNETGMCLKFIDQTSTLTSLTQFQVQNSTSDNNVAGFKSGDTVLFEWITPIVSTSGHPAPPQHCDINVPSTETTPEHTSDINFPSTETTPEHTTCSCMCYSQSNVSSTELAEKVANLTSLLTLDKKKLSSYTRQKNSAEDSRPTSKFVGSVGIIILITVVCLVTGGDVVNVAMQSKLFVSKMLQIFTKQ